VWAIAVLSIVMVALNIATGVAQHLLARGGDRLWPAILYYSATAALLVNYAAVVSLSRRSPSHLAWWILVPGFIQLGWLLSLPALSIDAFSYLVDAAHAHAGLNPYVHPVREAAQSEAGRLFAAYGWRPVHDVSPYGPLWMNLVWALGPLTTHPEAGVLVIKLVAIAAVSITALFVYRTADPGIRVGAFTAFWWNPVVIIEAAGEGHNDAVMLAAVMFSLWCLQKRSPVIAAAGLTAGVLTKWVPVLFAPAFVVHSWRNGMLTWRTIAEGAAVVAAIIVAAFWPFWAGAATFGGLRESSYPHFIASTTGAMMGVLPHSALAERSLRVLGALTTGLAVIIPAWSVRTNRDLTRACATTAVMYMLLSSPAYWAWYALLPIALLTAADEFALAWVLTAGSRLVAPLDVMRLHGTLAWPTEVWATTIVALWLPLAYVVWRTVRRRSEQAALSGSAR
jgi:hypothetical protein